MQSEVDQTWRSLASSFVNMHQSISHLVHATDLATTALSAHTNNAIGAQALQNNTNRAAFELAHVIANLRDVTHTELEWINGTGREIRERILQWESSSWNWGWGWKVIAWITRLAWHGRSLILPLSRLT
jgi:NAD-dependent DNA ligase